MRKKAVIYDQSMKRLAILENAYNVSYVQKMNALWTASFTLPASDEKNIYCKPFNFVEIFDNGKRIELFRIMPSEQVKSNVNEITYQCEHVLATLIDSVLFGYHQIGGVDLKTPYVLQYILDGQSNWKLGACDFARQFEYKWENENRLSALLGIPKPFTDSYLWTWDTSSYPWVLNLIKSESVASCELRYRKNLAGFTKSINPMNIVTRLYPLGYGEGDNQLNIKDINGGVPYLEVDSPYGIKEGIFVDRRYEDANSLKATAQAMLNELSVPYVSYTVDALDLSRVTESKYDEFTAGKMVHVVDNEDDLNFNAYIVEVNKTVGIPSPQITIANKEQDIATSISDLQERARIEQTYSQGATNLMQIAYADNADSEHPAILRVYIPAEMVRINKLILQYQLEPFRAFSQATGGGGGITEATGGGGGYASSTRGGGGGIATSETSVSAKWTDTQIYGNGWSSGSPINIYPDGLHNHGVPNGTGLITSDDDTVWFARSGEHDHFASIQNHKHIVVDEGHYHDIDLPNHTHDFSIPSHTHDVELPEHTHELSMGIYEGSIAENVTITVDGNAVSVDGTEVDIAPYLSTGDGGKILRNAWHEVAITPNNLTRIVANIFIQIFVNSRGKGDY